MDPLDGPHPGEDVTNLFCVFHSIEKQSNEVNITANTGRTVGLIYLASTSCSCVYTLKNNTSAPKFAFKTLIYTVSS